MLLAMKKGGFVGDLLRKIGLIKCGARQRNTAKWLDIRNSYLVYYYYSNILWACYTQNCTYYGYTAIILAYRRRNMRAKKSSKNVLRISGLALVFVLAVALLVSAISFTRTGAKNGNVSLASATNEPPSGFKFLNISEPAQYSPAVLNGANANKYFAQFTYAPETYKNYYAWIGGIYTGISGVVRDDSGASMEASAVGNVRERLYAYYKLPDFYANIGATVEVSANLDEAVTFTNMSNTLTFISYANEVKKINENSDYVNGTFNKGTTWKVTSSNQYILVYAGGEEAGSEKIEIGSLKINIKIKSVDTNTAYNQIKAKLTGGVAPVVEAWDGKTYFTDSMGEYLNISQRYDATFRMVGNLDTWGLQGNDSINSNINELTSLRTDGLESKRFSFMLYDKYDGLKTATINGFDLLQAYRGETATITDGSEKTYLRSDYTDKSFSYPNGALSIWVKPFGAKDDDATKGVFRGLYVTVLYDGKDTANNPIETDTAYRVNYTNTYDIAGSRMTVFCGGIDYTPPAPLNGLDLITENIFNNGVTYFYTNTIEMKLFLDNDDSRGDVFYYYTLYKKNESGVFEAVTGRIDVKLLTNDAGFLPLEFEGFEVGEYKIQFTAIDGIGRFYNALVEGKTADEITAMGLNPYQQGWANHTVKGVEHSFTIDGTENPPEEWVSAIYVDGVPGKYNGYWTNKDVVIKFNNLSSLEEIKYEISYLNFKNGVAVGTQTEWKPFTFVEKDGELYYSIGRDNDAIEGYERHYYLRATYTSSGIVRDYSTPVKFDDYGGYTPVSATLSNFTKEGKNDFYADLLPLLVSLNYKNHKGEIIKDFKGSPMTLYYTVTRDGVESVKAKLDLTSNDVLIDLFQGKNVSGPTTVKVTLWLEDEAGNPNDSKKYDVNLDRAKLNVKFSIKNGSLRYYDNTTDVRDDLVSYTVGNDFVAKIARSDIRVAFDARYDDANAGIKNVLVSKIKLTAGEGSAYTKILNEYELVYFGTAETAIVPNGEEITIGTHEIQKARLTLDPNADRFSATYNGKRDYAMPDFVSADGTLKVRDIVKGDKADEWKNITWKGVYKLSKIDVGEGLNADIVDIKIDAEHQQNYVIESTSAFVNINKAKLGKINIVANKVYDGNASIKTSPGNSTVTIEGLCDNDKGKISLDLGFTINLTSKDVDVYTINGITGFKFLGENIKFYDLDGVTADATVTVTRKTISATIKPVTKPFDNTTAFQIGSYDFGISLLGTDEVKLIPSVGNTSSVNVGTYKGCDVTIALGGRDGKNYVLTENNVKVDVTIEPRAIGGAKIIGIYAIDPNGEYYYKVGEGENTVIYQKDGEGYIAYSKDGSERVTVRPDDAKAWVLDTFVKGGVCIMNGHRFELSQDIVYAIEYYEDNTFNNKLNIGEIDFTQKQYQPKVVYGADNKVFLITVNPKDGVFNSSVGAYEFTLKIANLGEGNNFNEMSGFQTEGCIVKVLDFSDVMFQKGIFNGNDKIEEKFETLYNGKDFILKIEGTNINVQSEKYFVLNGSEWTPVEFAKDAGTYKARFTITRLGNEYIIEQTFVINKIETKVSLKDEKITFVAKYGEDFTAKVQVVDPSFGAIGTSANEFRYEYSYDRNFKNILEKAPVRDGAGTCYVRVIFNGNKNYIGSVSEPRAINISGVKFNLADIVAEVGSTLELPKIADIIDPAYLKFADDFRLVYLVNTGDEDEFKNEFKTINDASELIELVGSGKIPYTVVHKNLVGKGGIRKEDKSIGSKDTLAVSSDGNSEANIYLNVRMLESVDIEDVLMNNDLGTIFGNWTLPDSGYLVYFSIDERNNATNRNNFTNGLIENKDLFGKKLAADRVFFVTLTEYDKNGMIMNSGKQPQIDGMATVTMKVNANGAKLVRYADGEWTEVNYKDNGDGTITFDTDKLGYFILTKDYVAPTVKDNALPIGLGVGLGLAALLLAAAVITVVTLKKKHVI